MTDLVSSVQYFRILISINVNLEDLWDSESVNVQRMKYSILWRRLKIDRNWKSESTTPLINKEANYFSWHSTYHFVFRRYSSQEIFFIRVWYLGQESVKKIILQYMLFKTSCQNLLFLKCQNLLQWQKIFNFTSKKERTTYS